MQYRVSALLVSILSNMSYSPLVKEALVIEMVAMPLVKMGERAKQLAEMGHLPRVV